MILHDSRVNNDECVEIKENKENKGQSL